MKAIYYHKADLDGVLSGVIANYYCINRNILEEIILVPVDYGDDFEKTFYYYQEKGENKRLEDCDVIYVLDISDDVFFNDERFRNKIIWIDHHITAIEKNYRVNQYCVNGVAACRLTFQFFRDPSNHVFYTEDTYRNRLVTEPLFVTLAGEYDIWDHRSEYSIFLNFGIQDISFKNVDFIYRQLYKILSYGSVCDDKLNIDYDLTFKYITDKGKAVIDYVKQTSARMHGGSKIKLLGYNGIVFNTHIKSSFIHILQRDEDFIMVWNYDGKKIKASFYSDKIDVSQIAKKFNGGGHSGAAGCALNLGQLLEIYGR